MPAGDTLDLALRLWPDLRDHGTVGDPADLDRLLATLGQPGAPGYDCGLRRTFACFAPDEDASDFALPTGERPRDDAAGRFLAHVLVTRSLLAAGLAIDPRVNGAMCEAYALSWTAAGGGDYYQTPLALAASLWLPALDPDVQSDHPLPLDWSASCFEDERRWDPDYRLFSHYDIRDRALDWAIYAGARPGRHRGVSVWTIVEPLLRMPQDGRAQFALAQFVEAADEPEDAPPPAAAMLERNRIAELLREYISSAGGRSGGTA